ncbi:MAG: SDR family oxidoreductase [Ktedonobacteraceae bacterium]|nr:SDR family oxidoreductase [Ktedonobacteraceae bacterium]
MEETSKAMSGKTCLITGANSGIGKVTALELARMGATVVMVSRNRTLGERAQREIQQQSGNPNVDLLIADLGSQQQVRRLAREFQERYTRLHVLINNAGGVFVNRQASPEGIEMTFAVNYLAPFLLTHLLLDTLKASAPSRVINVSSDAHYIRVVDPVDWNMERSYQLMRAYGQSKLAEVLFTYELARRLDGVGVTANVLHPGVVATNIWSQPLPAFLRWISVISRFFGVSPEEGARTTIYLASSPEVEGVTGKYFEKSKEKKSAQPSYDENLRKSLWELSEQLTSLSSDA